jgi:hypothetical protein
MHCWSVRPGSARAMSAQAPPRAATSAASAASSAGVQRALEIAGLTRWRQRCAHCCPDLPGMRRATSLQRLPTRDCVVRGRWRAGERAGGSGRRGGSAAPRQEARRPSLTTHLPEREQLVLLRAPDARLLLRRGRGQSEEE